MIFFENLSKELQNIAEKELNELPHRVNEDIAHIRSWILKQPHIQARTDDKVLIIFLRSSKFSLEKTKQRLEIYYTMKSQFPYFCTNRDPLQSKLQYIFKEKAVCALPLLPNSPLLAMIRLDRTDPDVLPMKDLIKMLMICHEIALLEYPNSSVIGQAYIFDYQNIPLRYITQLTPELLKVAVTYFEVSCPSRLKAVYFINASRLLATAFNFIKSIVSNKLKERIFMHVSGDKLDIEKYFSPSVLPIEYGGQGGSFSDLSDQTYSKVMKYRDWLIEDEKYKCVGGLQSASAITNMDLFSVDGSFRKLEID